MFYLLNTKLTTWGYTVLKKRMDQGLAVTSLALFFVVVAVVKEPPYHIEQSGYGGFVLPIDIYFKNKEDPKKVHFDYDLFLPAVGLAPINNIRSEALTFTNPTEEFKKKLLKGGGTIIHTNVNGFHRLVILIVDFPVFSLATSNFLYSALVLI